MDAPEKPRPRWWRRKRSWAALALWLVLPVLYPVSQGPAVYALRRGWIGRQTYEAVYSPADWIAERSPLFARFHNPRISRCANRAQWVLWHEQLLREDGASD